MVETLAAMLQTNLGVRVSIGSLADIDEDQVALYEGGLPGKYRTIDGRPAVRRVDLNVTVRGRRYPDVRCLAEKTLELLTFQVTKLGTTDFVRSTPRTSTPNHFGRDNKGRETFQFRADVEYMERIAA